MKSAEKSSKGNLKKGVFCKRLAESYAYFQVPDGVAPPVPNRDYITSTEAIYDNRATTETNQVSECPDKKEETGSPDAKEVEGDTKNEKCMENNASNTPANTERYIIAD